METDYHRDLQSLEDAYQAVEDAETPPQAQDAQSHAAALLDRFMDEYHSKGD